MLLPRVTLVVYALLTVVFLAVTSSVPTVTRAVGLCVAAGVVCGVFGHRNHVRREVQRARRFEVLAEYAADFSVVVDEEGVIVWASPSVRRWLSVDPSALVGVDAIAFVAPETQQRSRAHLASLRQTTSGSMTMGEHDIATPDGTRTFQIVGTNLFDDPDVGGVLLVGRDWTENKALEAQLTHQALHDPLTDLPNRALFVDRLEHALQQCRRQPDRNVAVLMLDLDDFKSVNDSLGHAAGDDLLRGIGQRLLECVRPGDTVARFGGDEFAVLLHDLDSVDRGEQVARRLLEVMALPIAAGRVELGVRCSLGLRVVEPGDTVDALLRDADVALYSAKADGKGDLRVFATPMLEQVTERLALRTDLLGSWERGEMRLCYQPIVDLRTGQVRGLEALLRWDRPGVGPVPPSDFIPVAEQAGMIQELGLWVLRRACSEFTTLGEAVDPATYLSVNVSAMQLRDDDFADEVQRILAETGLDPDRLLIELTETVLSDQRTFPMLAALRAGGIRIGIDDFGTGYSSLAYLQDLPVDIVKIDQTFVHALDSTPVETSVIRGIVALAASLELETVAEGVEDPEQTTSLLAASCETGQGFLMARPLEAGDLAGWLSDQRVLRTG